LFTCGRRFESAHEYKYTFTGVYWRIEQRNEQMAGASSLQNRAWEHKTKHKNDEIDDK